VLRFAILAASLLVPAGVAVADPLWSAELRAGYGVAVGGGAGMASLRGSPITLELTGAIAVREEPHLYGFGGLVVETGDRSAAGLVGGVRLDPRFAGLRLSGGMQYIATPYTVWGPLAAIGACGRVGKALRLCGDVQATIYVGGSDLPDDKATSQFQLVLGVAIDDH
jgi:hypothetical protein